MLADLGAITHTISSDLYVAPGQYVILGRNSDVATNGGVSVDYHVHNKMALANSEDEILLLRPDGSEEDRVVWGGTSGLTIRAGKSFERIGFNGSEWIIATTVWPGSAGDSGTPGGGFVPPVLTPTTTATADGGQQTGTPTATATPTPTPTATSSPTSSSTPTDEPIGVGTVSVYISEFLADPSAVADTDGEWIELYNAGPDGVNLKGWTIADLDGDSHTIAADLFVVAGGYVVLARNADAAENGGLLVDYVYAGITLANSADEILLLRPNGNEEDRVVWGGGSGLNISRGNSLERTSFVTRTWATAVSSWFNSLGDFGTPGGGFVPPIPTETTTPTTTATADGGQQTGTPTATSTVTATPTVTATTATGTPTPTPSATPTSTASPTPSSTPTPTSAAGGGGNASVYISEFLADPSAVSDANGEWIELYNAGPDAVNLKGWMLADLDNDSHAIASDLFVAAGAYVVLGRNWNLLENGGVALQYVYTGVTLANSADEILLLRPDGTEEDRVVWDGDALLRGIPGKSLERITFGPVPVWLTATTAWPDSAGDFGTPGTIYLPGPTPTITPTPTATRTTTPTPITLPILWQPGVAPAPLQIDEVNFLGSDLEFVALVNVGDTPVDLTGWVVGDGATPGGGEGLYALPAGHLLASHTPFVIARNGAAFHIRWGRPPDAQFEESQSAVPVLARRRELATGSLALSDGGDEILLLDPSLALADGVVWGSGDGASLGLTGTLYPIADRSLQRVPGYVFPVERDQRHRFLWAAPAPFASVTLPESAALPAPPLADGLQALWGSLGAISNFTPGGAAPPHYVRAAGASIGLDFVAVADPLEEPSQRSAENELTAWRWTGSDGGRAVVYSSPFATDGTTASFLAELASRGGLAQWLTSGVLPASGEGVVAFAADGLAVPGGLPAFSSRWQQGPRLPAGNAQPPVAGEAEPNPRYTGLAALDETESALRDALAARRGWLTNRSGLALTLRAHTSDGETVWMGSTIEPQDALAVEVNYHDLVGEVAGLALWLNDRPIAQTDLPQGNGIWQATVSAAPGSVLYAVATQADGDFAVTAPLLVQNGEGAVVIVNEVLPSPAADGNGDGTIDSNDEFIELHNPGNTPVSLAGWRLEDRSNSSPARRRFVLDVEHLLPPGGFLVIWGRDSHIGLNDDGDRVELYDSGGRLVDGMEWNTRTERGKSLTRVPDGGNWQTRDPSPGRANPNDAPGPGGSGEPSVSLPAWGSGAAPGTPGGEAVGPFRSITAAKLAGMEDGVRFVGVVTVPPGLFNSAIYVADPALPPNDATAWLGVQVYLRRGTFPELAEGDRVDIQGTMHSFRGEREILVERPEDIWRVGSSEPLQPLPIAASAVGEPMEGRLVTFEGIITGWSGVSLFLADPDNADAEPVMVTVRNSLGWRRPYVNKGERWLVTGIVSQSAATAPWNGGYRLLVRYPSDLVEK